MSTDPDTILLETEDSMTKSVDHLKHEFRGLRTGRASPSLVEFLKADYYGSQTELKSLAAISCPEPTQILIKPFDTASIAAIRTAIETSGLGLNPSVEGAKQIRVNVPSPSSERRQQMVSRCKKLGEESKIALRNTRRDANKHAETLAKQAGTHFSEDDIEQLKTEIQALLKKYEDDIDKRVEDKSKEIMQV